MKTITSIALILLMALAGAASFPAAAKDIKTIRAPKKFDYSTQRTVPVDIRVARPGGLAAVSLLASYPNAPRLLQTGLTDATGRYRDQVTLPAAVRTVIVSIRYEGKVKEVEVPAKNKLVKRIRF